MIRNNISVVKKAIDEKVVPLLSPLKASLRASLDDRPVELMYHIDTQEVKENWWIDLAGLGIAPMSKEEVEKLSK